MRTTTLGAYRRATMGAATLLATTFAPVASYTGSALGRAHGATQGASAGRDGTSLRNGANPRGTRATLVVVNSVGGLGLRGEITGQIVVVQNGHVSRILVSTHSNNGYNLSRGLLWPFRGGIAPSPDGRYVIFGNEHAGLWAVRRDGTRLHRLVRVPPPPAPFLGVEGVAMSSGGLLAYAVNPAADSSGGHYIGGNPQGIWVVPFRPDTPTEQVPRKLVTNTQIGPYKGPLFVSSLSWFHDQKHLIASTGDVVFINASTGTYRRLIPEAGQAAVSPTTGEIAYMDQRRGGLWLADAAGGHRRMVLRGASTEWSQLAWSPDGRQLAYIGGPVAPPSVGRSAIHIVDLASRVDRIVLRASAGGQHLLAHGYFAALAWLPQS